MMWWEERIQSDFEVLTWHLTDVFGTIPIKDKHIEPIPYIKFGFMHKLRLATGMSLGNVSTDTSS